MDHKWHYDKLIETRKNRNRIDNVYYERHHIIPRSMGGSDDETNLIYLTAREHFIAHWLLWLLYRDTSSGYAFSMMRRRRLNQVKTKYFSSKGYAAAKEAAIFAMKNDNKRNEKISKAHKNKVVSLETREKQSICKKGVKLSYSHVLNLSGKIPWNKGKVGCLTHTDITKSKISKSIKQLKRSEYHNKKIGESNIGKKHPHSEETKQHFKKIFSGKGNPRSKNLKFIDTFGIEYNVQGKMKEFCKAHHLNYNHVSQVLNNKRENDIKGWKVYVNKIVI
jgi:hypothetical protein